MAMTVLSVSIVSIEALELESDIWPDDSKFPWKIERALKATATMMNESRIDPVHRRAMADILTF